MECRLFLLVYVLFTLFLCAKSQQSFDCDEDFCTKKVNCPKLRCRNGSRIFENATQCGCCHICVEEMKEGEQCVIQAFSVPTQTCGNGLICDKEKLVCVPVKTPCIEEQRNFDSDESKGTMMFGKTRPVCDEYGDYESVVCISDVLCFCVDKQGNRLFGTDFASRKDSMDCNCSRELEEFPRHIPMEDFLRCLPNGDYDKLQCTEKWCYCMQDTEQTLGYVTKANTTIKNLQCYDDIVHQKYDSLLLTKCLLERLELQKEIKKLEDEGVTVIGIDLPKCDLDGSYAPVQCKKDRCYCVKTNGEIYEGFSVPRNSKEAKEMRCRCPRERDAIRKETYKSEKMKIFEKFRCLPNGNYKTQQCVGSKSYDVNSAMGYQISTAVGNC